MSDRYIQLALDGEKDQKTRIETGILQGSPVSPILFLIYIRFLFEEIDIKVPTPSYMDDIAILAIGKELDANCEVLQRIARKLIQWGQENGVEFDQEKTELIHFYRDRTRDTSISTSVQISDTITIEPKEEVR